jgi:hypothetical protein
MSAPATELDVARAIASGELPSPTQFYNAAFYAVRISGTGCAWRESIKEFVWREPKIWLSSQMVERVRGCPVVWQHPKGGTLDSESFASTVVGSIVFAFVRDSELWGVARILDAGAAKLLDTGEFDTSPAVLFGPGANSVVTVRGERLLVEETPALIDHLAICGAPGAGAAGVWSKGDETDKGVEITDASDETSNERIAA